MEPIRFAIARYRRKLARLVKAHNGKPRGVVVKSITKEQNR